MKFKVKSYPLSGRQEVIKKFENELEVYLKSPRENNKANIELIKILEKYFGKQVKIKSGKTSKRKVVEVIDGN
jgi:uncharacterized protein (TIGR00251 family)